MTNDRKSRVSKPVKEKIERSEMVCVNYIKVTCNKIHPHVLGFLIGEYSPLPLKAQKDLLTRVQKGYLQIVRAKEMQFPKVKMEHGSPEFSEAIREGLEAAKQRGVRLGKPKKFSKEVNQEIINMYFNGESTRVTAKRLGVSPSYVCQTLAKKGNYGDSKDMNENMEAITQTPGDNANRQRIIRKAKRRLLQIGEHYTRSELNYEIEKIVLEENQSTNAMQAAVKAIG